MEADSNGIFRFRHGTLYPILHRMEANELILGRWSSGKGRRKKVYSLTDVGRRHLSGETDRVQEILSGLLRMLRRAPGGPGVSSEASQRESVAMASRRRAHEKPTADETPANPRAFLPALRRLDRDLTVPVPDRLRILRELEFDLEALSAELEARGMPPDKARARALDALVPDGATLRQLDRLHAPHYRRLTRHFNPGRLRTVERSALVLATLVVLLAETALLLRADWLHSPSPFLWPVLGLGALLFAAIAAQSFKLWIKRDHGGAEANFRIILLLSGVTLTMGIFGAIADFFRLAGTLQAEPGLAGSLFLEWLTASCVLLSFSFLLALAGGLAWFIPAHWLALVSGARAELLGHHPSGFLANARTGTSRSAAGGVGQVLDPVPVHHPESMGEKP